MASPQAELGQELYAALLENLYSVPPERRAAGHWVMNAEWWAECVRMTDAGGRPVWDPPVSVSGRDLLLGKPVEVRDDGGVPHLET